MTLAFFIPNQTIILPNSNMNRSLKTEFWKYFNQETSIAVWMTLKGVCFKFFTFTFPFSPVVLFSWGGRSYSSEFKQHTSLLRSFQFWFLIWCRGFQYRISRSLLTRSNLLESKKEKAISESEIFPKGMSEHRSFMNQIYCRILGSYNLTTSSSELSSSSLSSSSSSLLSSPPSTMSWNKERQTLLEKRITAQEGNLIITSAETHSYVSNIVKVYIKHLKA